MATNTLSEHHAQPSPILSSGIQHVRCSHDRPLPPPGEQAATTLLHLLSNDLILRYTAPLLSVASRYALARTSKAFNGLIVNSNDTFRYLDLSPVTAARLDHKPIDVGGISWRYERMDEALTEDEFYSGPLQGIMSMLARRHVLKTVSTMILDGLAVPADIVGSIIMEDRFNVRILSIREAKHLNERKLMQVLKYAVRPSRPEGMPKLKGVYIFGPMDPSPKPVDPAAGRRRSPTRYPDSSPDSVMSALGAQLGAEWNKRSQEALTSQLAHTDDKWWQPSGRMFKRTPTSDWAETLASCEGIIHFDAVLCRSPRHDPPTHYSSDHSQNGNKYASYLPATVASIALGPSGCAKCGSCPELPACFGSSLPAHLPLLTPPPCHAVSIRAAQMPSVAPSAGTPKLIIRCAQCLHGRWCERCQKWWCEDCYQPAPTLTQLQQQEAVQLTEWSPPTAEKQAGKHEVKVFNNLCVESCLVGELMSGGGEGGMWG